MAQTATKAGFRLGIYVFKDAEIIDFAAPYGVFSVARRYDPELDVFLIADASRPVQAQAGFTVLPNYSFNDPPSMDAFLIPGGFGTRQEMHNQRLFSYIRSLPESCLLTSVCTGSWIYARMGLLDGIAATNRKEPDRLESSSLGMVPIDRLAKLAPACRVSRARVVDSGRDSLPAASLPVWRWVFICCAVPATPRTGSPTSRAPWSTRPPTTFTAATWNTPRPASPVHPLPPNPSVNRERSPNQMSMFRNPFDPNIKLHATGCSCASCSGGTASSDTPDTAGGADRPRGRKHAGARDIRSPRRKPAQFP